MHYLGLLEETEARTLFNEPLQRSLPKATYPSFDQILPLTGFHPLLLQLVADRYWIALEAGFELKLDDESLILAIHNHIEDFWFKRSQEELSLLIRAAAGRELKPNAQLMELKQRGLLIKSAADHYQPFCEAFKRLIEENMPQGKSLIQAATELERGAEHFFDIFMKWAERAGKIYAAFKGLS